MEEADRDPYPRIDIPPADDAESGGLARIAVIAALAGAFAGLVGALFRKALLLADETRTTVLEWTRDAPVTRWLIPVALAAICVAVARWIVRAVPEAAGSGVQRIEATMRDETELPGLRILPAKFVGGVLAIGSGLALGREGPTVQMAAAIGATLGRWFGATTHDRRTLTAALAGAGLGVAFSAPLGGMMFVFEEVTHAFRTRLVVATVSASAAALAVAAVIVGPGPILPVSAVDAGPLWMLAPFLAFGMLLGVLGVAYNRLILFLLDNTSRIQVVPPEVKAGILGGAVGLLGIAAPEVVGGGEALTATVLLGGLTTTSLALVLLIRWFLGPASYAVGTPGGLFAPLIVVGALTGALVAQVANAVVPGLGLSPLAFGLVGMSAFFASTVRAPITGIILVVEMTATTSLLVPMLVAGGAAVLVASALRAQPIYDELRSRLAST